MESQKLLIFLFFFIYYLKTNLKDIYLFFLDKYIKFLLILKRYIYNNELRVRYIIVSRFRNVCALQRSRVGTKFLFIYVSIKLLYGHIFFLDTFTKYMTYTFMLVRKYNYGSYIGSYNPTNLLLDRINYIFG